MPFCFFARIWPHHGGRCINIRVAAIKVARTRIKICGITSVADALAVAHAGADAIGLVFYPASPRAVEPDLAADIIAAVGPFVTTVGLFVNADAVQVTQTLERCPLQVLQFHGDEDPEYCAQFGRTYLKAVRMADGLDPVAEMGRFTAASGFVFDAWQPDQYGGTGQVFDWQRLRQVETGAVVVAGGLDPGNVAQVVRSLRPYAVDVSSGVEVAPGRKSTKLIVEFVAAVKSADELCL